MTRRWKFAVAAAGVAAAVAAGAAIASNGHGNASKALRLRGADVSAVWGGKAGMGMHRGVRGGDDLAAAASYLGTTTSALLTQLQSGKTLAQVAAATSGTSADGLIAALVSHEKQELAAAVTAGRLTQAQADAMSATVQQRVTDMVNGVRPAFPGGFGRHGGGGGDDLAAAASYLGTTTSALLTQLQSGKTLAQVAAATSGTSADGLIAALVSHEKQELAAAVTAGRLTQAQADAMSATVQQRVTDMVNGVRPPFPGGFGGRHGWGGPPPGGLHA